MVNIFKLFHVLKVARYIAIISLYFKKKLNNSLCKYNIEAWNDARVSCNTLPYLEESD